MSKIAGEINAEMVKKTGATQSLTDRMIESLRQQLAAAQLEREAMKIEWDKAYEIAALASHKLAAALAACKLKDESLEAAHNGLRWWMDAFPLHVTEADNEEMLKIVKALAIRPGTEALEKWLGEPVAIIGKHGHPKHISAIPSIEENRLYGPFEPLYAKPKGIY